MGYSDDLILAAWEKATLVPNNDSGMWRKDACGAWIQRSCYNDRASQYGWEIDLVNPSGPDEIENLLPLLWKNHVGKGDGRLICNVTASGVDNKIVGEPVGSNESDGETSANFLGL